MPALTMGRSSTTTSWMGYCAGISQISIATDLPVPRLGTGTDRPTGDAVGGRLSNIADLERLFAAHPAHQFRLGGCNVSAIQALLQDLAKRRLRPKEAGTSTETRPGPGPSARGFWRTA